MSQAIAMTSKLGATRSTGVSMTRAKALFAELRINHRIAPV